LLQLGVNPSEALIHSPTPKTIRTWVKKRDDKRKLIDSPRKGRPKKHQADMVDRIVEEAKNKKFTTPKGIKRKLDITHVHARTIRRRLNEAGLFGRIARVTPPLNPTHIQKRLSFVNGYGDWTTDQ
jgi:ribosomal protein S25